MTVISVCTSNSQNTDDVAVWNNVKPGMDI